MARGWESKGVEAQQDEAARAAGGRPRGPEEPPDVRARRRTLEPATVRALAVLDRTKEPGSDGEPLYKDVMTALAQAHMQGGSRFKHMPRVIGGRYGRLNRGWWRRWARDSLLIVFGDERGLDALPRASLTRSHA